jgi:hypothetical protein
MCLNATGRTALGSEIFRELMGFRGMLVCLSGEFMAGSTITFVVGDRGGSVCVRGQAVEFDGSIVRSLRHSVLLPNCPCRKSQRGLEIFRGACACGCETLIHLRALVLRFSRREAHFAVFVVRCSSGRSFLHE